MCGSTSNQNEVNNAQISFMNQLQGEYATEYGENQDVLNTLTSSLTPIINAGPNQQGYSPAELTALNSQATQGAGQAYQQEAQALGESQGAAGGGNVFMPSAATQAVKAGLGASAENNLSNQKLGITTNNYAVGRANYGNAVGALSGVPASIQSATSGAAGSVTGAGSAAASEANSIQQANDSWEGLVGGLAGSAASAYAGR